MYPCGWSNMTPLFYFYLLPSGRLSPINTHIVCPTFLPSPEEKKARHFWTVPYLKFVFWRIQKAAVGRLAARGGLFLFLQHAMLPLFLLYAQTSSLLVARMLLYACTCCVCLRWEVSRKKEAALILHAWSESHFLSRSLPYASLPFERYVGEGQSIHFLLFYSAV